MTNYPLVSVIIPTKNSGEFLRVCLESIKNQTYKNVEVIVVDNYSSDKTIKIAKKLSNKVFQLNSERNRAKNFGVEKAKGEYVLFLDSDMELAQRVVEECVNLIEKNRKVGGIIIPERSVGNGFWVKVRDFERSFYAGTEIEFARFFRKELVKKVNGFDEGTSSKIVLFSEDSTLPHKLKKLGTDVKARIKAEILHHEDNFSLGKWLKKKVYGGKTLKEYMKRYKKYGETQVNPVYRLTIFLKNKKFYLKPSLVLGILILKSLEYFATSLGCLTNKIKR
ncbi:glycosyl transferase family 2 [Parcubacteria bacterium DG_74_2]|nr:MAG: glycosyl transferase family 2 [Parcubacteria bacterium DG_74_2]